MVVAELNSHLESKPNKAAVVWEQDDKNGLSLDITNSRYKELLVALDSHVPVVSSGPDVYPLGISNLIRDMTTKSRASFTTKEISTLSDEYLIALAELRRLVKERFRMLISTINANYHDFMVDLAHKVGEVDLTCSLACAATKYNYCKPEIVDEDTSYVKFKELRHAIVERELCDTGYGKDNYVPHSFDLGTLDTPDSATIMLLYGSNMCGKSTLLRGVGIAVVLAQMGSYVPAESFTLSPYKAIYARILTIDNLHKSRSSFQHEMLELAPILNITNMNSLVLADEPCHSTNQIDAYALVLASIEELGRRGCSCIITTHLHELSQDSDLDRIHGLRIYHLAVEIRPNKVRYARLLKPGPGPQCYGIEVASEVNIPKPIIERAYQVRRRLLGHGEKLLSFKTSNYSSQVYMDKCEICGQNSTETHHDMPQADADARGYIGHVPVHSATNLRQLCETCHVNTHGEN
jgi:DNA mismatch repair protein MutS